MSPKAAEASTPGTPDLDRAATLHLLISIARAFKSIDDRIRPHLAGLGLSITEFAVLEVLLHKGPIPLGELAGRILVTGASTTYTVKKLEARGLLTRTASEQDQRVIFAALTPAGHRLIEKVFPLHAMHLQQAMCGLSRQEKRDATRLLRKLEQAAKTGPKV